MTVVPFVRRSACSVAGLPRRWRGPTLAARLDVTLTISPPIVESHTATRGSGVAVIARDGTLTYRDSISARTRWRYLIGAGFGADRVPA
jgi:hypothetical protein